MLIKNIINKMKKPQFRNKLNNQNFRVNFVFKSIYGDGHCFFISIRL